MNNVTRAVVQPPNQQSAGDRRSNSYLPLLGTPGPGTAILSNGLEVGRPNGSIPSSFEPSPIKLPDHRFHVETALASETSCALTPGRGAIPVEPQTASDRIVNEMPFVERDSR